MAVMSLILSVWMIRSFRAKWTNWQDILKSFGMRYFLSVKRDTKIQILSKKASVFFQLCDEAVGLSEEYSQRKATALDYLEKVVIVDILGLILLIGAELIKAVRFAAQNKVLTEKGIPRRGDRTSEQKQM